MEQQLITREDIKAFLEKEGVVYKEYQHRPALPMEEWVEEFKQFEQGSPFIKNLIFNCNK